MGSSNSVPPLVENGDYVLARCLFDAYPNIETILWGGNGQVFACDSPDSTRCVQTACVFCLILSGQEARDEDSEFCPFLKPLPVLSLGGALASC